ncbi:MAG: mandelate racemase/muconate lactonizing enzyme family protein [Pseudomonadota bacterium]
MKIARIDITHHRLELDPPFWPTWDSRPRPLFAAALVRVESDSGHVGYGSGDAMPGFDGHEELFLGRDPLDLAGHYGVIENLSFHLGKCWPLDLALWDLAGKIHDKSVWQMLGGTSTPLPAYASLGQRRDLDGTVRAARAAVARGFKAVKIRFFREDWREDVAVAQAVRAALGAEVDLMVDCNQAWRMQWDRRPYRGYDEALALLRALEPIGIYWIEEPLFRGDHDGLRQMRRESGIRIAGGELTRETHEAAQMVRHGCFDVLQCDVALAGGISGLRPIARLCQMHDVLFTPHTWGNGIMLAAAVQFMAGIGRPPNPQKPAYLEVPDDPPDWTPDKRDFMLTEPILVTPDGTLLPPTSPGLGFELDRQRLARTRI